MNSISGSRSGGLAEVVNGLSVAMIATALVTFIALLFIKAPFGRYSTSKGWGPLIPASVAWMLMESPNLLIPTYIAILFKGGNLPSSPSNMLLFGCFLLHYIQRTLIYPMRMGTKANPMPLTVALLAFIYCSWNASIQSLYLICIHRYPANDILNPILILGVLIFFTGFSLNIHADGVLLQLRRKAGGYSIPEGGLFGYISCANYGAEILEWTGFAIASRSIPAFAFAIFVFANLAPRAHHHHRWYLSKFEDYPKDRRAIIPFIW